MVDLGLFNRDAGPLDGFPWLSAFLDLFSKLPDGGMSHHVKVLLVSYGSELPLNISEKESADFVIHTRAGMVTARQQYRARRMGTTKRRDEFRVGKTRSDRLSGNRFKDTEESEDI